MASRPSAVPVVLLFANLAHWPNHAAAAEPAIRVVNGEQGRPVAFEAVGLSADRIDALKKLPADDERWGALLSVRVFDTKEKSESPPMLGKHSIEGATVRFTPRYPLRPGLRYRVTLVAQESGSRPMTRDVTVSEEANGKVAEISHVFPTAAVLPENQLKFYLHFSAPMARGESYEHLQLLKADGQPVDLPFLEIGEELWDGSGRPVHVADRPGPNQAGRQTARGPGAGPRGGTRVHAHDRRGVEGCGRAAARERFPQAIQSFPPDPNGDRPGRVEGDTASSRNERSVHGSLSCPLDRGLLERTLTIFDPSGDRVSGRIAISDEERLWQFHPETAWKSGKYHLAVDTALEDLAGNQIGRPFEVDRTEQITKTLQPETVQIPFVICRARGSEKLYTNLIPVSAWSQPGWLPAITPPVRLARLLHVGRQAVELLAELVQFAAQLLVLVSQRRARGTPARRRGLSNRDWRRRGNRPRTCTHRC